MTAPTPEQITKYLQQIEGGDATAIDRLLPHVYDDLHRLAGAVFRNERSAMTLQPTALVHEAYLKLVRPREFGFSGRRHFMSVAAMAMRQVLANRARDRSRLKRGGSRAQVTLTGAEADREGPSSEFDIDLIVLDEALGRLEELDPGLSRIVELRFFAGLKIEETAEVLQIDQRTVRRRWALARAWLRQALEEAPE